MEKKNTAGPPAARPEERENLERFIKNNLSAFDEEPAGGHYERLQAKQTKTRRRAGMLFMAQMMAAACIAVAVTVYWRHMPAVSQTPDALCENTADMKSCYFDKMNAVAAQIREIAGTLDSMDAQDVMMEVENILLDGDDIEQQLPEELSEEAAKAILSGYYQHHLETLQSIAEHCEGFKI
ncbi:MAG: hypothetical protein LBI89_00165 [Prevotellaceae bacterium]|jgi:hypothetical protein|nr:hypothetical protein [Prevotellaceae bacterium]